MLGTTYLNSNLSLKQFVPGWLTASDLDKNGYGSVFSWDYGLVNNEGYLTFHIGWIDWQIKVGPSSVKHRYCYGNNGWTAWKDI